MLGLIKRLLSIKPWVLIVIGLAYFFISLTILSPMINIAYAIHLAFCATAPSLFTLFLLWRGITNASSSKLPLNWVRHMLLLCAVGWFGWITYVSYMAMDDAPRGLLWDFYVIGSLIFGSAANLFLITLQELLFESPRRITAKKCAGLVAGALLFFYFNHNHQRGMKRELFFSNLEKPEFAFRAFLSNKIPDGASNFKLSEFNLGDISHTVTLKFNCSEAALGRILEAHAFKGSSMGDADQVIYVGDDEMCQLTYTKATGEATYSLYGHYNNAIHHVYGKYIEDLGYELPD